MPAPFFQRIFILIFILALCVSCAAQTVSGLPSFAEKSPASTATFISQKPEKTRQSKQAQTLQVFPTSSYVPVPSELNLILGRPTTDSITASLYTQSDTQINIVYGTASNHYTTQTKSINLKGRVPQNIELTQLSPNTTYYYQVTSNGTPSGEHTFHTQRAPGSTFAFTIDADPHNRDPNFNSELYVTALTNARSDQPDFHINLGDTFMTEKVKAQSYAEAESTFTDMRPYFGILGTDAPLFLVNGNHEGELGWLLTHDKDKNLPIWSTQLRQMYYPNPVPNNFYTGNDASDPNLGGIRDGYYAWTWGDALFVVLDPFWNTSQKPQPDDLNNNWNWTLGREQYDWLKIHPRKQ